MILDLCNLAASLDLMRCTLTKLNRDMQGLEVPHQVARALDNIDQQGAPLGAAVSESLENAIERLSEALALLDADIAAGERRVAA